MFNKNSNISVVMITLNEVHNLDRIINNLKSWVNEVFILDSYSTDGTLEKAKRMGCSVYQRKFTNFGDQWNYAIDNLPLKTKWVMKVDPDEELSEDLKINIVNEIKKDNFEAIQISRVLYFMNEPLNVSHKLIRVWKNGHCKFSEVKVNEHPIIDGRIIYIKGDLLHHDSFNIEHWINKQNKYTSLEAEIYLNNLNFADQPILLGTKFQRRMWLKKNFYKIPFRYVLLFLYFYLILGSYKSKNGYIWAKLKTEFTRIIEIKIKEK